MHISIWKPLSHCAALLLDKKPHQNPHTSSSSSSSSIIRRIQEAQIIREALEEASENGSLTKPQGPDPDPDQTGQTVTRSRSLARLQAQKEFLKSTSFFADQFYFSPDSIPNFETSLTKFLSMYPKYKSSDKIDELRETEYSHLSSSDESSSSKKVILDYCGFGLFSFSQSFQDFESSNFTIREISTANLNNHALYGGPEIGTVEYDIKIRIMDYLNVPQNEYVLIFTTSRGSAFKLLAECYPFQTNKKLLTMFDHESQSVNFMVNKAKSKGTKVISSNFKFPTLKLNSLELRKEITKKKRLKKDSQKGLFVFPVQSRVTGAKYSYQWMALAQQNNWHVLLDAGSLGPKDMDSLGLSLFRPDFIITSFYRVFGSDPTGFGCLLIKKSVLSGLGNPNGCNGSGMVRLVPVFEQYLSDNSMDFGEEVEIEDFEKPGNEIPDLKVGNGMPVFSGVYSSSQVREVFEEEEERESNSDEKTSTIFEENENIENESVFSICEVMKSPAFSEEDGSSENESIWVDLGLSPNNLNKGQNGKFDSPSWLKRKTKKVSKSPLYDNGLMVSFDEAVLSASNDICEIKEEERESGKVEKESAIRRETEGEFRLLGRREKESLIRVSLSLEQQQEELFNNDDENDDVMMMRESLDLDMNINISDRKEPEIICKYIDHIDIMGLNRTSLRLRYLVNWLVISLLQLKIDQNTPLVSIYGPKIKYERGASVAFNVRLPNRSSNGSSNGSSDGLDGLFVKPEMVLKMAEREGILLGLGFLTNLKSVDEVSGKRESFRVGVVTASLGFLTNFEDVYRMWGFVARFLERGFLESQMEMEEI